MALAIVASGCGEAAKSAQSTVTDAHVDVAVIDAGVDGARGTGCASDEGCDHSGDSLCAAARCDAETGACALQPRNDGAPCEDGDPCTVADVCAAGACKPGAGNACECAADSDCPDDGDACNGTAFCQKSIWPWRCGSTPPATCGDDGDACTVATCEPQTGGCELVAGADGVTCDDGDACTVGDACKGGACAAGGTNVCTCSTDADCKDDGDLCNGKPYCDKNNPNKPVCKPNPGTVVSCPADAGKPCQAFECQPSSGLCTLVATDQSKACDDGDACSKGEVCQGGLCGGGADICSCANDADCAGKDDGDLCNGTPFCNLQSGKCETNPKTKVLCPTVNDTACSKNACLPATGACSALPTEKAKQACDLGEGEPCRWVAKPIGAPKGATPSCDDGDACTASDGCSDGSCEGGTFVCSCSTDADCAGQDDGDLCNGVPYCDKNAAGGPICKPNPASVVVCQTLGDTDCLVAKCQPATGLCAPTPQPIGTACEDGNPCSKSDFCSGGKCLAGVQTCECQTNADCLGKDDGDLCNGVLYCDKSDPAKPVCKDNAASTVFCPPTNQACVLSACDPKTGVCQLAPAKVGSPCDDGDACTANDACSGGLCSGEGKGCDDGNLCTVDSCDDAGKCVHKAGNCDDGNACTADTCDPKTGDCAFATVALQGKPCVGDDDGCTVAQSCQAGACKGGKTVTCVLPTQACEVAQCASTGAQSFQCIVVGAADGAPCDDGAPCSLGDGCLGGSCVAGEGTPLYARALPELATPTALDRVAVLPGGDIVVAGVRGEVASGLAWVVGRYNLAGQQLWSRTFAETALDAWARPASVWVRAGGELVVVGSWGKGGARKGRVVALSPDGKLVNSDHIVGAQGAEERVQAGRDDDAGGAWLVSRRVTPGVATGALMHVNADGLIVASATFAAAGVDEVGAYGRAIDGAHLIGTTLFGPSGQQHSTRLVALEADGQPRYQSAPLPLHNLHGVASDGSFTYVAGDAFGSAGQQALLRLDAAGKVRWSRKLQPGSLRAVIAVPGVGAVAAGYSGSWDQPSAALVALGTLGSLTWQRTVSAPAGGVVLDLTAEAGGSLVGAGFHRSGSGAGATTAGLLLRLSAYGHISCAAAGVCLGKSAASCSDGNPCTDGVCGGKAGCVQLQHSQSCDDGDACTGGELCSEGACGNGKQIDCPDAEICATVACEKGKGCVTKLDAAGVACDDGDPCTVSDACDGKAACTGEANTCDDGVACTWDKCVVGEGCANEEVYANCDDSNPCTHDVCDKTAGTGQGIAKGCVNTPHTEPCDDGVACTVGAVCSGGKCLPGDVGQLWGQSVNAAFLVDGHAVQLNAVAQVEGSKGTSVIAAGGVVQGTQAVHLHAVGLDAKGKQTWNRIYASAAEGVKLSFTAVIPVAANATLFGFESSAAGDQALAYGIDSKDGAPLWNFAYKEGSMGRIYAAVPRHGGGVAAAGVTYHTPTSSTHGWLLQISDQGFQLASTQIGGSAPEQFYAITRHADGYAMTGVRSHPAEGTWVVVVDEAGKVVWERDVIYATQDFGTAIGSLADGGLVVGGTYTPEQGKSGGFALALGPKGVPRWRVGLGKQADAWAAAGSVVVAGIGESSDGSITVVESNLAGRISRLEGKSGVRVRTISLGEKKAGGATKLTPRASAVLADDGLLLAGWDGGYPYPDKWVTSPPGGGTTGDGFVLRLDPFGHSSCVESGACASKTTDACDDGNACTDASCAAGKCDNQPAIGRACDGQAFCAASYTCQESGACVKAKERLFEATESLSATGNAYQQFESREAAVPLADGGFLSLGYASRGAVHWPPGSVSRAVLRAHHPDGTIRWESSEEYETCGGNLAMGYHDALVDSDGYVVTVGTRHHACGGGTADAWRYGAVALHDAFGLRHASLFERREGVQDHWGWRVFNGVVERAPGKYLAVGYSTDKSGAVGPWLLGVRRVGLKLETDYSVQPEGVTGIGTDVAVTEAGEAVVSSSAGYLGYFELETGKLVQWAKPLDTTGKELHSVVASASGALAAGLIKAASLDGDQAGYIAYYDGNRKLAWEKTFDSGGADSFAEVRVLPGGRAVAVGTAQVAGDSWQGRATFIGLDGVKLNDTLIGGSEEERAFGSAILADGRIVLVGQRKVGVATDAWFATMSQFGHTKCVTAGLCADVPLGGCDDGKACTADACDPGKGCTYTGSCP